MTDVEAPTPLLVLAGASYVADWKQPELGPYRVVNRGVGGEQTHEVLERFERDVLAVQPQSVLLWGHINNVHRASPGGIESAKQQAMNDYREMVQRARAAGIHVVLATEVTLSDATDWADRLMNAINRLRGKRSYNEWVNEQVRDINEWLRTYALEQQILLLDFEKLVDDGAGFRQRKFTAPDGTHISQEGYAALTKYTRERLSGLR